MIGGITDSAIYKASGKDTILAECPQIDCINRGGVAITPASNLNAKHIIHSVVLIRDDDIENVFETLSKCYITNDTRAY